MNYPQVPMIAISPTHRSPATGEPTPGCEGGKGAASGSSRAASGLSKSETVAHYQALAAEAAALPGCRVCRVAITRSNTHLPADLRAVGMTWDELEVCDKCRPGDDERYGVACFEGRRIC
jgi:hypothetical protein